MRKMYKNKYFRVSPGLNTNQMAELIKLMSPEDQELDHFENCIIDACQSHSIIYDINNNVFARIFDTLDNIDIDLNRIRLNYSSGGYILVKAW